MDENRTAWEKLVRVGSVESSHPVRLVEPKLFVYDTVVVLVKPLVLGNFFPQTMPVVVIGDSIFVAFSPEKVFQDQQWIELESKFAIQPNRVPIQYPDGEAPIIRFQRSSRKREREGFKPICTFQEQKIAYLIERLQIIQR